MQRHMIEITNLLGLHARAAAKLVQLAARYTSTLEILCHERLVNAKSIMGVMMLAASKGTTLELIAQGPDEEVALQALVRLIQNKFGETE